MAEEKGVEEQTPAPSALENAIASSPEVEQQVQEAVTPPKQEEVPEQEPQQAEDPRVPYSRLKEVVDEKNYFKTLWEQERQRQQPPQQDPLAGMTAEEREFWRKVDERAARVADQRLEQVRPVIDAGRMELAQMKVQEFRRSHPDIKPNSQEEVLIAEKIQMGYHPEDAYWAVKGPRGFQSAERQGEQKVRQQVEAKRKANVESSSSIPTQAQPKQKLTFREEMERNLRLAEEGKL